MNCFCFYLFLPGLPLLQGFTLFPLDVGLGKELVGKEDASLRLGSDSSISDNAADPPVVSHRGGLDRIHHGLEEHDAPQLGELEDVEEVSGHVLQRDLNDESC